MKTRIRATARTNPLPTKFVWHLLRSAQFRFVVQLVPRVGRVRQEEQYIARNGSRTREQEASASPKQAVPIVAKRERAHQGQFGAVCGGAFFNLEGQGRKKECREGQKQNGAVPLGRSYDGEGVSQLEICGGEVKNGQVR